MYPEAYIDYLHFFHCDRDYFECHEVLEEHWKERDAGERELHWVGLIQIAVGLYHHRRANYSGAGRMLRNAVRIIEAKKTEIRKLSLDSERLITQLKQQISLVENKQPYESIDLPITDESLLTSCREQAALQQKVWGAPSDMKNKELIHRHSSRDRQEVITERLKQLQIRKNQG